MRSENGVKLFEISDIYSSQNNSKNRYIGIIAGGRAGRNYENFSKELLKVHNFNSKKINKQISREEIARADINSKLKSSVYYLRLN